MKATGIVRRIDDLGRVVIPKEIRRTMRLREGEPLEIYTEKAGEIILKKYSPIADLSLYAQNYAESFSSATGAVCIVADRDNITAVAGANKRELMEKRISPALEEAIGSRKVNSRTAGEGFLPISDVDSPLNSQDGVQIVAPIIASGDVLGAVVVYMSDEQALSGKSLAQTGAAFLGRLLEE